MNKRLLIYLLGGVFVLQSCFTYRDVEIEGVENYNVENLFNKSKDLKFILELKIKNPNTYNIKIKKADLNLYVGDKDLGPVHLKEVVKIPKKSTTIQSFVIIPESRKILQSALFSLKDIITSGEIEVRIKGKIKGKVAGVGKWFDVDHSEDIDIKGKLFIPSEL